MPLAFPRFLIPAWPSWDPAIVKRHRPVEDVTQQPHSAYNSRAAVTVARRHRRHSSSCTNHGSPDQASPPFRHNRFQSHDSGCVMSSGEEDDENYYTSGEEDISEYEYEDDEEYENEDGQGDGEADHNEEGGDSGDEGVEGSPYISAATSAVSLNIYLDSESGYGGSEGEHEAANGGGGVGDEDIAYTHEQHTGMEIQLGSGSSSRRGVDNHNAQEDTVITPNISPSTSAPNPLPISAAATPTVAASSSASEQVQVQSVSPPTTTLQSHLFSKFAQKRSRRRSSHTKPPPHQKPTMKEPTKFLNTTASYLSCSACRTHLCFTSSIISKGFTGRHGRAYLVADIIPSNIVQGRAQNRPLQTGQHTVADINCAICDVNLGWKYLNAEERTQWYKIGKYILETGRVDKTNYWDGPPASTTAEQRQRSNFGIGKLDKKVTRKEKDGWQVGWEGSKGLCYDDEFMDELGSVEVDLADEEELEEMFAGSWNPENALKRRERKQQVKELRRRVDSNV